MITNGDKVLITDANGVDHEAVALGGVEPGHKFRIVWVTGAGWDRVPWPADSVRPAPPEPVSTTPEGD